MCLNEISFPVLYRPTCPSATEPSHWLRGAEIESRLAPRLLLYPIPTTAACVCVRERRRGILRRCTHTNFTYGKEFYVFPPLSSLPLCVAICGSECPNRKMRMMMMTCQGEIITNSHLRYFCYFFPLLGEARMHLNNCRTLVSRIARIFFLVSSAPLHDLN